MIEQPHRPIYKIKYTECKNDKQHEGEQLNIVCLSPNCRKKSLICSMCKSNQHSGHPTKPLKFYLQELKEQYERSERNYQKQLQVLQESRITFFLKLKDTIQQVAQKFRNLEEEMMVKFEQVKTQIIQKEAKKNKFQDFYHSLVKEEGESSLFLIQNYLPEEELGYPSDLTKFQKLKEFINSEVQKTQEIFKNQNSKLFVPQFMEEKPKVMNKNTKFLLAKSIQQKGNLFIQKNPSSSSQSMNLMNVNLSKELGSSIIKVKATKIKKGSIVTVGAITKTLWSSFNFATPKSWLLAIHKGELFFYNNKGIVYGEKKNQLKTFSQGSAFDVSVKNNVMTITMNKKNAEFNLPKEKQFFFFFCIQGNTEVEIAQCT